MSELVEFLLARIAEDEAAARVFDERYRLLTDAFNRPLTETEPLPAHVNLARVLRECEAKRRIIGMYVGPTEDDEGNPWAISEYGDAWLDAVRYLAAVYVDHADYRNEWAVSD